MDEVLSSNIRGGSWKFRPWFLCTVCIELKHENYSATTAESRFLYRKLKKSDCDDHVNEHFSALLSNLMYLFLCCQTVPFIN